MMRYTRNELEAHIVELEALIQALGGNMRADRELHGACRERIAELEARVKELEAREKETARAAYFYGLGRAEFVEDGPDKLAFDAWLAAREESLEKEGGR